MSKELHIALQNAIGDLGTDVLKSPHLVNILQDYGAFDVHDVNRAKTKTIIELFSKEEYGEKFIAWRNNREKNSFRQNFVLTPPSGGRLMKLLPPYSVPSAQDVRASASLV